MTKQNQGNRSIEQQLDAIRHVLEDLFILQALTIGVGGDSIRGILGVRTARISKIMKGVKKARKHGKEQA